MVRDDTAIYINLAPEFGATRLGPYQQLEIRFGSDQQRCHVFVPESFGVAREHCKLLRQQDGLILTPAERTAAVFVWKGDVRRPSQVLTPTAIRSGDAFSLVTPEGPKFFVEIGKMPVDKNSGMLSSYERNKKRFTVSGFLAEVQRVVWATLYTLSPVALLARAKLLIESGYIFTPRFIVSALLLMSGWIMAAPASCSALKNQWALAETETELKECNDARNISESLGGDTMSLTAAQLIATLLGSDDIAAGLQKDQTLSSKVRNAAKNILDNSESYEWLYQKNSSAAKNFSQWRQRTEKIGLDINTTRLAPYLAAPPNNSKDDYASALVSGKFVCTAGPLRLTWLQARGLGMKSVAADSYQTGDVSTLDAAEREADRWKMMLKTYETALDPSIDLVAMVMIPTKVFVISQGQKVCVHEDVTDDRLNPSKLAEALSDAIGENGPGMPKATSNHAAFARIARIYAANDPQIAFEKGKPGNVVSLVDSPLSETLKNNVPSADWVMDQTAQVIARATILPCMAALQPAERKGEMEGIFGKLPDPLTCLVLNYRLANE